jgi:drug/metabolite transporter (DMT)-like permease
VRLVRDVDPLTLTAVQFATGLAVVTPVCVAAWTSGAEPLPGRVSAGPVVALLLSGCVGTAGAFLVYTWALARVSATSAGAAATLIPLFALGFTVLGGQPLTRVAVLAAVLVVLGLLAHVRAERRPLSVSWQVGLLVVGGPGAGPLSSACRVASTAPG